MKLYEIHSAIRAIELALDVYAEENEGLVDPNLDKKLEALELTKDEKLDNCIATYRNYLIQADIEEAAYKRIKQEADRFKKKANSLRNRAESFKNYIDQNLSLGEKFKGANGSIYRRIVKRLLITDDSKIPSIYLKHEVRKRDLENDLKSGVDVQGAELTERAELIIK